MGIVNSSNITVSDLTLDKNGQGVLVAYSDLVSIDNITATDNELGSIFYSSPNNTILNSNISSNDYNGYHLRASGIYLHSSVHNTIVNSTVSTNVFVGIYLYDSSDYNIINNNTCNSNKYVAPIWAGYGIKIVSSSNNVLTNNTVNSNSDGIYLYYSSNNLLANNTCNLNTGLYWGYGIYLAWSSNNNITYCNLSNNRLAGIALNTATTNTITNCNTSNNDYSGIYLVRSSSNIITNCTILNNDDWGICLISASSATITYNDIKNNDNGVRITGSSDPTIHNNTISGNTEYGIKNEDSSVYIHAEYNWWGEDDNSGPYDPSLGPPDYNPDGNGDKVSDYVYYDPWLAPP